LEGSRKLSNNVKCSCVIPSCNHYGKEEYAELNFIKKHLRKHSFNQLKEIALQNGLISSVNGFVNFDWLIDEIVKLCRRSGAA
jgi:hypothetical protein